MDSTISTVQNCLKTVSFPPGAKILVAVSGGADSVAMLHILHRDLNGDDTPTAAASASEPISQSKSEKRKAKILCAHINHQLRDKESDKDETFTAELCKKLNIPFFAERIDVKAYAAQKKLSIETAARQLRIDALVHIARRTGCQVIATAHHKDDQAETILFRLLRGTAFAGLAAIRPVIERDGLQWIRPMLHLRRTDIESYCRQNNLSWRQDASNLQTHFRRNWIRHRLLPLMQQGGENDLTEKLAALAQSALSFQRYVESAAVKIFQPSSINHQSSIFLSAAAIKQSGPFVAGEILRAVLNHLHCGLRDISLSHYQRFFRLLDKNRAVLELPGGCVIRKKNNTLAFEAVSNGSRVCSFAAHADSQSSIQLPAEGTTQFANWRIQTRLIQITQNDLNAFQKLWKTECSTAALGCDSLSPAAAASAPISQFPISNLQSPIFFQWFDLAQIQAPIIVRCRHKDDSFIPFGRKTPKKISRFLTDSQIDPKQRESCFVIEDKTGILWLAPVRRAARAAVRTDTIDVLEISLMPKDRV
ncbi:MAG: tRNA lysidine(34) synthetase TilS [Planctomycetes bacterium]|nr:tRNA lysidine(34) synthetase TilS [Planctomycetota bacterium]